MEIELNRTYYLVDYKGTLYSTSFWHRTDNGDYHYQTLRIEHTVTNGQMVFDDGYMTIDKNRGHEGLVHLTDPLVTCQIFKFKSNAADKCIRMFNNKIDRIETVKLELAKVCNIHKLIDKV